MPATQSKTEATPPQTPIAEPEENFLTFIDEFLKLSSEDRDRVFAWAITVSEQMAKAAQKDKFNRLLTSKIATTSYPLIKPVWDCHR